MNTTRCVLRDTGIYIPFFSYLPRAKIVRIKYIYFFNSYDEVLFTKIVILTVNTNSCRVPYIGLKCFTQIEQFQTILTFLLVLIEKYLIINHLWNKQRKRTNNRSNDRFKTLMRPHWTFYNNKIREFIYFLIMIVHEFKIFNNLMYRWVSVSCRCTIFGFFWFSFSHHLLIDIIFNVII